MSVVGDDFTTNQHYDVVGGLSAAMEETLRGDKLNYWVLSHWKRTERRQAVLEDNLALPPELPYGTLVGSYRRDERVEVETKCCAEDVSTTLYRHVVTPVEIPDPEPMERTMKIKRRWLTEARKGPIPASAQVLFGKEVQKKKWLALSYEQEMRQAADVDISDNVRVRSVKMSSGTLDAVKGDTYVVHGFSSVGDLWHDGCTHPTGTGLWDPVGGVLPYVAPNATVVKVPCSTSASNGTWLFQRSKGKEECFLNAMVTLLGTGHKTPLKMQRAAGSTFTWSGMEGFRPNVKLGGSDRFWLRIEQMAGMLRGNMIVGRNAEASVLWAMSWFRTLLESMRFISEREEVGPTDETKRYSLAKALVDCKTWTTRAALWEPIGMCAAAVASMIGLELDDLVEVMDRRLRVVWQQWRLAIGTGKLQPDYLFKQSLIAPLAGAEMYEKDDSVKVTLFFMYIVQRLAERDDTLLNAARHYGGLGYRQPYAALTEILRPEDGFRLEMSQYDIWVEFERLIMSFDTHEEWELNPKLLPYAWRNISGGSCFAGSLTTSQLKTELLTHCWKHRVDFMRDSSVHTEDVLSTVRALDPQFELLNVFQQCKKQFWPQRHPRMGLWLSNDSQGLVVVNVFAAPNRDMEQASISEPGNELLVIPELVSLRSRDAGRFSIIDEAMGGLDATEASESSRMDDEAASTISGLTFTARTVGSSYLDKDQGTLQWRVRTDEGEKFFSYSDGLQLYQLVFKVTSVNVSENVAHLICIRRCESNEGAARVPIDTHDVKDSGLAAVDGVLYGRVNLGLREMMPGGKNFKNSAGDYYRLKPNGSVMAPLASADSELTAPIVRGLRAEPSVDSRSLYSCVIDRLWKMAWH